MADRSGDVECVRCGEPLSKHLLRGGTFNAWCPNGDGVWVRPKPEEEK